MFKFYTYVFLIFHKWLVQLVAILFAPRLLRVTNPPVWRVFDLISRFVKIYNTKHTYVVFTTLPLYSVGLFQGYTLSPELLT